MKIIIILFIILADLFKLSSQVFDVNDFYSFDHWSVEKHDTNYIYHLSIPLKSENKITYAILKWSKQKKIELSRLFKNNKLKVFNDTHNDNDYWNTSLIFLDNKDNLLLEVVVKDKLENEDIQIKILKDEYIDTKKQAATVNAQECLCKIEYQNRSSWDCPWGEGSENFIPEYSKLTHFVIHHQGGNAEAPYANVVKAIWNFHVYGNGWSDIGYHWLIDPNGVIYKGRAWLNGDEQVKGAHTCACNSNKIGICLLGNLNETKISDAQYESLKKFIAAKACGLTIFPGSMETGTKKINGICEPETFATISGHKDICGPGSTDCPGNQFYPLIDQLILEIENEYLICLDTLNTSFKDNISESNPIEIYPNPNSDDLFEISGIEGDFRLNVYNEMGKPININLRQVRNNIQFFLKESGLYFIKIQHKGKEWTAKVLRI